MSWQLTWQCTHTAVGQNESTHTYFSHMPLPLPIFLCAESTPSTAKDLQILKSGNHLQALQTSAIGKPHMADQTQHIGPSLIDLSVSVCH